MDIWLPPKMTIKIVDSEADMKLNVRMKDLFYNENIKGLMVLQICSNNSYLMKKQYNYCPRIELFENMYYKLFEDEIVAPSLDFLEYLNSMIDYVFDITYLAGKHETPYTIKLNITPNNADTNIFYLTKDVVEKGVKNNLSLLFGHKEIVFI